MRIAVKRHKAFVAEFGLKFFNITPLEGLKEAPEWICKTNTFKHGVADGSIMVEAPVPMPPASELGPEPPTGEAA